MKDEAKRKNTENRENTEMNEERTKLLQSFLERLSEGESMESVQADFVKHFESVDAEEIMLAEQSLIEEGMPVREVQKLCDFHSALFHTDSVDQRDLCGMPVVEAVTITWKEMPQQKGILSKSFS